MTSLLRDLGVFGFEPIEDALVAALVTGDPLLLVGRHGAAKTAVAGRVATALGFSFHAYDASKALFEDVLGFPDPRRLAEGQLDYVPTPISIWDKEFVLVDELSRATPQLQSKWLEVIRSRKVMGKPATRLCHVWAAMNPPDYLGAQPLDDALLGRFAFVIKVPEAVDLSESDLRQVITAVGEDDAPALPRSYLQGPPLSIPAEGQTLAFLVEGARAALPRVRADFGDRVADWVAAVVTGLRLARQPVDGRRLGFLWRNTLALLAVRAARRRLVRQKRPSREPSEAASSASFEASLLSSLRVSLPFAAQEKPVPEHVVLGVQAGALRILAGKDPAARIRVSILFAGGPLAMTRAFIAHAADLPALDLPDVVTRLEDSLARATDAYAVAEIVVALRELAAAPGLLRGDPARRVASRYAELTGLASLPEDDDDWTAALPRLRRRLRSTFDPRRPPPDAPWEKELGYRVAQALAVIQPRPSLSVEGDALADELEEAFRALAEHDAASVVPSRTALPHRLGESAARYGVTTSLAVYRRAARRLAGSRRERGVS